MAPFRSSPGCTFAARCRRHDDGRDTGGEAGAAPDAETSEVITFCVALPDSTRWPIRPADSGPRLRGR